MACCYIRRDIKISFIHSFFSSGEGGGGTNFRGGPIFGGSKLNVTVQTVAILFVPEALLHGGKKKQASDFLVTNLSYYGRPYS